MSRRPEGILLIGYGNPGRLDDGLGPRLADAVAALGLTRVTVISDYQLQVEHAPTVADHESVVFADASVRCPDPFEFREIEAQPEMSFSTHSVSPAALLSLAHEHFGARTRGYVLAIRGHAFNEFGEQLSARAQTNLEAALEFIAPLLERGDLSTHVTDAAQSQAP